MNVGRVLLLTVLISALFVVSATADRVFVAESSAQIRPAPGLVKNPFKLAYWGESFERVKMVGENDRWSRISLTAESEAFIWTEWIAVYEIAGEKDIGQDRRQVSFTVNRYLAGPTLEAMCNHILESEIERNGGLKELGIKGYLVKTYPNGEPLCAARWSTAKTPRGTGGELDAELPDYGPVTSQDMEISKWLEDTYKGYTRGGRPIFEADSLWIEAGEEFSMTPEMARLTYDRVRWKKLSERDKSRKAAGQ